MTQYIEYNLINNIPILYPCRDKINFTYCPRYTIANSDNILKCSQAKNHIEIYDDSYKFIKVDVTKSFRTLNNEIVCLYCFVLIDSVNNYDFDFSSTHDVMKWLFDTEENHFILITTPVLKYKNTYYSIANNDKISIVSYNDIDIHNDNEIIKKMVDNDCYTICDNYNVIISLYQNDYLTKPCFKKICKLLEKRKFTYFITSHWFQLINKHRILNAYDFPILFLFDKPKHIDQDIFDVFDNHLFEDSYIYLHTLYQNNVIFSTILSNIKKCYNKDILNILLKNDLEYSFLINDKYISDLEKKHHDDNIKFDFYGIFSLIITSNSIWKLWKSKENLMLQKISSVYDILISNNILDLFCPLFHLYNKGLENTKIKRSRIRKLWISIIIFFDKDYDMIFEHLIAASVKIDVPYMFLSDVLEYRQIDFSYKYRLFNEKNILIQKYISLYDVFDSHEIKNNIYYFHHNVLKKRMLTKIVLLYKKFGMFIDDKSMNNNYHTVGEIIISYIQNDKQLLF